MAKPGKPARVTTRANTKSAAKPSPRKAVKPAAKAAPKKAVKPAAKAAPKKAAKPAAKAAPKKAAKPAAKAAPKKAAKPASPKLEKIASPKSAKVATTASSPAAPKSSSAAAPSSAKESPSNSPADRASMAKPASAKNSPSQPRVDASLTPQPAAAKAATSATTRPDAGSAKKKLLARAADAKSGATRSAASRPQPFVPRVNAPPLGPAIEAYVREIGDWRGLVVTHLCQLIAELAPTAVGMVKWGRAVYERNGPFAFVLAERHIVRLGFWRGSSLEDPERLLAGGDGPMRHFNLWSPTDVREERFSAWVREAVRLNQTLGDPTKPAP